MFVTRAAWDDLIAQRDAIQAKYDALVIQTLAMKREGFVSPAPSSPDAPAEPVHREPSALSQVIREQAMGPDGRMDTNLAAHLRSYAAQLKREKKTEAEILEAIRDGWRSTEQDYQTV